MKQTTPQDQSTSSTDREGEIPLEETIFSDFEEKMLGILGWIEEEHKMLEEKGLYKRINCRVWDGEMRARVASLVTCYPRVEMLATGIKDKNGKEIYEGDIVRVDVFGDSNFIVKFGKYCIHSMDIINSVGFFLKERHEDSDDVTEFDLDYEYTVIGNIYENPELIDSDSSQA